MPMVTVVYEVELNERSALYYYILSGFVSFFFHLTSNQPSLEGLQLRCLVTYCVVGNTL